LTGRIDPNREYPDDDQRRYKPRFKPENVRKVHRVLEPMRPIAARHNINLAQLTIAWTLAQPGCSHVLCGARDAEQAINNSRASSVQLSDDELQSITQAANGYDGV
jgi:aryl-alcohol dehydrogenase-like predicted oxidoreductase